MTNRTRIIEAAAELFFRDGFQATTVEDILAATGVARSNFYYHFTDKQELAHEVVRYWIARCHNNFVMPTLGDRSLPPRERLQKMFERAEKTQDLNAGRCGSPLAVLATELVPHDQGVRGPMASYFADLREQISATIGEGVERGDFVVDNVPAMAEVALSLLQGALLLTRAQQELGLIARAGVWFLDLLDATGSNGDQRD